MKNVLIYLFCFLFSHTYSQHRTLFSVSGSEVSVDDFLKNYYKNRLDTDTLVFSESLKEYLDLYIKFKLKVVEAQKLGLDTTVSFKRELDGYRSQLIKPYLTDTDVSENLLQEAYDRLKYEVSASHILIQSTGTDTVDSYNKILDIKNQIDRGANFIEMAQRFSEDPSVKENQGDLGYFSALYMVYPFESAAYKTPVGSVSEPVKTRFGYHLLKINDKRPSRGEVKVAHILIKNKNSKITTDSLMLRNKIYEIYDSLMTGADFSQLANRFSDDKKSASVGGELDWFGANKMVKNFEKVAFSLDSINSFSKPFQTDFGWHIVKLIDKKFLPPLEELRESLKKRVERDSRSQKTRNVVVNRLKKEWGFVENIHAKKIFYKFLTKDFIASGDDISKKIKGNGDVLFVFNNQYDVKQRYVYQKDFADFFNSFKSRMNQKVDIETVISELYNTFKEKRILQVESDNLVEKYDDFRLLYNEYHDGILMYQLQKEKVWDKAIIDTLGLQKFYTNNQTDYTWPNRVSLKMYASKDSVVNKKVYGKLKRNLDNDTNLLNDINKKTSLNLSIERLVLSKGDNHVVDEFVFNVGLSSFASNDIVFVEKYNKVLAISEILPESPKLLNDIKGTVISDYQSFLEKEWIAELTVKYPVNLNNELFLLAQNREVDFLKYEDVEMNVITNSFNSIFAQTVKKIGVGKNIYFGWKNNIYTTELRSNVQD